ncbi:MAG: hypothetical protein JW999_09675 [Methanotrichaceae archaeon]|nr:hypothetical protein [Methanotrichaceae archaeon]
MSAVVYAGCVARPALARAGRSRPAWARFKKPAHLGGQLRAQFLDRAPDGVAFCKNAGPEAVRIDYQTHVSRLAHYIPDFPILRITENMSCWRPKVAWTSMCISRSGRLMPG